MAACLAGAAVLGTSRALAAPRIAPSADATPTAVGDDDAKLALTRARIAAIVAALERHGVPEGSSAMALQRDAHLGGVFRFDTTRGLPIPSPASSDAPGVDGRDDNRFLTGAQLAEPFWFASPWGRPDLVGARDADGAVTLAQLNLDRVYARRGRDRLCAVTLLEIAGALPRSDAGADAAQDAYLRDRGPDRPWNDAWGHPLIVAWGLFQPGGDDAAEAGARCAEAWRQYQYDRAVYVAVAAVGPVAADADTGAAIAADGDLAAWRRDVLPRLWREALAVCAATDWTPTVDRARLWRGVRGGSLDVGGRTLRCALSAPSDLR